MEETRRRETRFWQKLVAGHMQEMRAAKLAGLFPKSEGWRNVVEHELVEFEVFSVLAEAVGLSEDEKRKGATAALLHDVYKRRERETFSQKGVEGIKGIEKEQAQFIRSLGYEGDIADFTKLFGGSSLQHFLKDPRSQILALKSNIPLVELVMHYVDDITLGSDIVSLKERVAYVKKRYREEDEAGREMYGGRLPSDVQYAVGSQIEELLAKLVQVDDPQTLPVWIKRKIEEKIDKEKG